MPGFWTSVALIGVLCATFLAGRRLYKNEKRRRIIAAPFPDSWERTLLKNVSLYRKVPPALRERLRNSIKLFIAEKRFEGCNGLVVTEEIRVTIAGQACLLLMNRPNKNYPGLTSILVYPSAYLAQGRMHLEGGAYVEGPQIRAGESWTRGVVVLAWDHVQKESSRIYGGKNVVLHEFAHQLDQEDGIANGVPVLSDQSRYASWSAVFQNNFQKLRTRAYQEDTLLDEYGTLNPAEFFAVATEAFFKKPFEMKIEKPDLYAELKEYYRIDPAEWLEAEKEGEHPLP